LKVSELSSPVWTFIQVDTDINAILDDIKAEYTYSYLWVKEKDGEITEIRGADNANLDTWTDLLFKSCPKCGIGELNLSHEAYNYTGSDGTEQEDIEAVLLCSQGCGYIER